MQASFSFIFVFTNKQYKFYNKIKVKNVISIQYGARIQTHDLWNMSHLP